MLRIKAMNVNVKKVHSPLTKEPHRRTVTSRKVVLIVEENSENRTNLRLLWSHASSRVEKHSSTGWRVFGLSSPVPVPASEEFLFIFSECKWRLANQLIHALPPPNGLEYLLYICIIVMFSLLCFVLCTRALSLF